MVKKLNILLLSLTLILCCTYTSSAAANNSFIMHTYYSPPKIPSLVPGRTPENDIIIFLLLPYLSDAFKKENIQPNNFDLNTITLGSITPLPNEGYKIELSVRTFDKPYAPPYGFYTVTVIIDGNSVNVTNINPISS